MKTTRKWAQRLALIATASAGVAPAGCSDEAGPASEEKASAPNAFSEYAIHVFAKTPEGYQQVDFPPVGAVSAPATVPAAETGTTTGALKTGPANKPQVQVQVDGGVKTLENSDLDISEPGWALLMRAVAQCEAETPRTEDGDSIAYGAVAVGEPWKAEFPPGPFGNWYVFRDRLKPDGTHRFPTCDFIARRQELLVCAAGRLKEAADTLSPISWPALEQNPFPSGMPAWAKEEWLIVPQTGKDKFILRDLAINALAHAARLELEVPELSTPAWNTLQSCTDVYVDSAKQDAVFTSYKEELYGTRIAFPYSYFTPNLSIDLANADALAESRLRFKTHILRAGARLLKDLVDESVFADLAGAEKQRALTGDTQRGPEKYWGARTDADAPYNSLAHAFRIVFGRWETRRPTGVGWGTLPVPPNDAALPSGDPKCGGFSPIELIVRASDGKSALGNAMSARWKDKRVLTVAQRDAVGLIDLSGIVIPKIKLDDPGTSFSTIKSAVKEQLIITAAVTNDPTPDPNDPITLARAADITKIVDAVNDADLRFALDRAWTSYRLVAGAPEGDPSVAPPPGVKLADPSAVGSGMVSLGANVLTDGIPKQDAAVDAMARVGPGQAASMCPEHQPVGVVEGSANMGKVSAFQDAFLMGDFFRRRLSALRQSVVDTTGGTYPSSTTLLGASAFPRLADIGSAEIRAWTGPSHVMMAHDAGRMEFNVFLLGLDPEDLGLTTRQQLKNNIVLVWGKPWVADCAARTRSSCPADFARDYIQFPSGEFVEDPEIPLPSASFTGSDERVMKLSFPHMGPTPCPSTSGPCNFQPVGAAVGAERSDFLYLVALNDPQHPGKGRVLATFPYYSGAADGKWVYSLISSHQRKLANDLFAVPKAWGLKFAKVAKPPASDSPSYCIDGVPRDFFVPLENELTSDNDEFEDSWKHYLDAAKQAAQRADDLGAELIRLGLEQDYRREAANEETAKICGEFGAVDATTFNKGKGEPPPDDATLQQCLKPDLYDVVFLSQPPPTKKQSGATLDIRTDILNCCQGVQGVNPPCTPTTEAQKYADAGHICKKYKADPDDEVLREKGMAGLLDVPYYDPTFVAPPTPTPSCDAALDVVQSATTGFQGDQLQSLASDADMSPDAMAAVLNGLRVVVNDDLHWDVYFEGARIMSTTESGYYPLCAPCSGTSPTEKLGSQLVKIFGTATLNPAGRDALLQRITGTIWLMAGMSGLLPEAIFDLPIPARDGFQAEAPTTQDVAPVLYGTGEFTTDTNGQLVLDLAPASAGKIPTPNIQMLGIATNIHADYIAGASTNTLRPQWVRNIYSDSSLGGSTADDKYRHVRTVNAAFVFKEPGEFTQFYTARGNELKGVKTPSCTGVNQNSAAAAKSAIFKVKEPDGRLCFAPDGKRPLMHFSQEGSGIADIFEHGGDVPATDIIPYADSGWSGHLWWNHDVNYGGVDGCIHDQSAIGGYPTVKVKKQCLNYASHKNSGVPNHSRFTLNALTPQGCPKQRRAQLFVNSMTPYALPCDAAAELASTLALTCVLNRTYRPQGFGEAMPPLQEPGDIVKLENWIADQSTNAKVALSKLYVTDVPKRVIDDFQQGKVGTGALKGEAGQLVLQYRQHLSDFASGWLGIEKELEQIRSAISHTRIKLKGVDLDKQQELATLTMQEIQIHAQILKSLAKAAGSVASAATPKSAVGGWGGAGADIAQAGIDVVYGQKQLAVLDDLKKISNQKAANQVVDYLTTLASETNDRYTTLQQTLHAMQGAVAGALQTASAIKQKQDEANYHVAKGAGEPYVVMEDGKVVKFPVNAVLRRQYDITKRRYDAALKESKYMSYMARLAIEQRIGIRLADMHEPIGALPAPAEWADDVCSFQGVNYELLSNVTGPPNDSDPPMVKIIKGFLDDYSKWADPYIGDYVDRLEKFVEFYNITYPSHEGDDIAVLSVRDDLLGPQGRCHRPSVNLLFHSHNLDRKEGSEDAIAETAVRGWVPSRCEAGATPIDASTEKCLSIWPGTLLTEPTGQPFPDDTKPLAAPGLAAVEGFTWLKDAPISEFVNSDPTEATPPPSTYTVPPGSVYQAVELDAGSYVLSWYDRAWGTTPSQPATAAGEKYRAMVYGPTWENVASFIEAPHYVAGVSEWSERRLVAFDVTQPGTHYVLFGASLAGTPLGSVVISDVQLERASATKAASAYEATGASRLLVSGDCVAGSGEAFREAFDYACDDEACFYELRLPFVIDTRSIDSAESKLIGKIAEGNFNFRHISTALNVVGTGVTDCSSTPTPSCYGTGYLEYSMVHEGFSAPIVSHLPEYQAEFNFGAASINRGKALAAERFITVPLGSADQALVTQPEIQKPEFRGRPLSGEYWIRIYDAPHLVWSQVEDVQIVVNYRYWSRVDRESQTK